MGRDEVYCTNAIKYRLSDGDKKGKALQLKAYDLEGYAQLFEEIKAIKPNAILALGNVALKALTGKNGISHYRGSILETLNTVKPKVVATYHPSNILKETLSYSWSYIIKLDFQRAVEESRSSEFKLPQRNLVIARRSHDLRQFLQSFKDRKLWAGDIETHNGIPICLGLAPNRFNAICVPLISLFESLTFSELLDMWKVLSEFLCSDIKLIGQNWKFDRDKLWKVCRLKLPPLHADTQLLAGIINPEFPKKLEFLTSLYTREPYYKDEGREFDPSKHKIEQLLYYNCKDCCVTYEAFEEMEIELKELGLEKFFYDYIMKLDEIYVRMEQVGFRVDREKKDFLIKKYESLRDHYQKELDTLAGRPINVQSNGQNGQVGKYLYMDLKLPLRSGVAEDDLVGLLGNHCKTEKQKRSINLTINVRRYRKSLSTYLYAPADYDERMRTSFNETGTDSGRTSTTILRKPVRNHKMCMSFQTMTKHGEIGGDIREFLCPDEGKVLVELDIGQAEARIACVLSDDRETLKLFDTVDIHKWTANLTLGTAYDKVSKDERFIGKTCRYTGQNGGQKKTLMRTIMTDARKFHVGCKKTEMECDGNHLSISEWAAGQVLDKFHAFTPKLRKVFHEGVKLALSENNATLVNPFGRPHTFFDRDGDEKNRKAINWMTQSPVRDLMGHGMIEFVRRKPDVELILEAHDAIVFQEWEDRWEASAKLAKECLTREIDFSRCSLGSGTLVLPIDVMMSPKNYKELKSVKV